MTDDRKRKTGGEVELLPLPRATLAEHWFHKVTFSAYTHEQMYAYARENMTRATAEIAAERDALKEQVAELETWKGFALDRLAALEDQLIEAIENSRP